MVWVILVCLKTAGNKKKKWIGLLGLSVKFSQEVLEEILMWY